MTPRRPCLLKCNSHSSRDYHRHILTTDLLRPNLPIRARLLTQHINQAPCHLQCLLPTLDEHLASRPRITVSIRVPHPYNSNNSHNSGSNSLHKRYHRSRRRNHPRHQT